MLARGLSSICLSLALCAGLVPAAAFADEALGAIDAGVEQAPASPTAVEGVVEDDEADRLAGQNASGDVLGVDPDGASDLAVAHDADADASAVALDASILDGNTLETQQIAGAYAEAWVTADERDVQLWLRGVGAAAQEVSFAVWSDAGGQNDIVWYGGAMLHDGSWLAHADRCATSGEHIVHAYAKINGVNQFIGEARFKLSSPVANVNIIESGNGYYVVKVSDITLPTGVVEVVVPTWTVAGGQDDILWRNATPLEDGSWVCRIDANGHGAQDGLYASHVYVKYGSGVMTLVGICDHQMTCTNYIYVTGAPGSGQRQVCIKNPTHAVVHVPTWSEANGQDDIVWFGATDTNGPGGLVWVANINCSSLRDAGTVISDIYVNNEFVGRIAYDVTQDDIIPARYRNMYHRVQGLNSASNLLIAADTDNCVVGIYEGSQGNWRPIHYFACSPGAWGSPSRKGIFTVGDKGYAFGTNVYTCYYYTQYSGDFLFHSILYNAGTRVVQDGRLGMHLSHGCIRLAIENAKWIYDNVPRGSRVLVF